MALLPTLPTIPSLTRRQLLQSGSALGSATLPGLHAQANWPTKSIRFVVPFAPGGSSEIVARSTAAELSKSLGQSVYVENKPGAAGNIAMQEVARADDQHTVILGHIGTLAVNPYIFPKLPYDPNKDFQPVSLLAKVPSLYVVHPDVPAKNLKEFVAYVRANPGKFSYGSAGNGSAGHLAFEYLKMTANLHAACALQGHRPDDDRPAVRPAGCGVGRRVGPAALHQGGKVRCIATGSTKRLPSCPMCPPWPSRAFPASR
jgi:tripartite-type tricarboxylate transporter receptor subunit TctC